MQKDSAATSGPLTTLVRQEWTTFRTRGRTIAMTAATLFIILPGLLIAYGMRASCSEGPVEVACPSDPVGPDGQAVSDRFYFVHRPLGENGSITARVTSMTGIITYPPPNHDEIVPGLVPWAKAGVIVKDGLEQGSSYAALMVTGSNGVRMQYDYIHDIAGSAGGVSSQSPLWLRLTRSGDTITGYESIDGARWAEVGTVRLIGLPRTVEVGLFTASPGDLTLRPVALGGSISASRFTQATAVFDNVNLEVDAPAVAWSHGSVGQIGHTDWERYHRPPGLVESNGTFTVTGTGDIGPIGTEGGRTMESTLVGLTIGLTIVIAIAVGYTAGREGSRMSRATRLSGRMLAARSLVIGAVAFVAGLLAAGVAVLLGMTILQANGNSVLPVSGFTELRVIVGVAVMLALVAVLALALGALLRRTWVAILVAISIVILPYVLGALPLLPDDVSKALLRLTPAAGYAIQQTSSEYPQVVAHYAPSTGYFPLAWWTGLAVLCGYTAVVLALALFRPITESRPRPSPR
jgi:hypothetical protein